MRNVTVFTTVGKQGGEVFSTEAVTWGQLKKEINTKNISLSNMKAVIGETQVTLESEEAQLLDGDFTLFLMPVKTKSGGLSRKELFDEIKAYTGSIPERKALFVIDGKNMTQLSTPVLQELYDKHIASKGTATPKAKAEPKSEPAIKKAEPKAEEAPKTKEAPKGEEPSSALNVLRAAYSDNSDAMEALDLFEDAVNGTVRSKPSETEAQRLAREKKETDERLAQRAREIARNFNDVRN